MHIKTKKGRNPSFIIHTFQTELVFNYIFPYSQAFPKKSCKAILKGGDFS